MRRILAPALAGVFVFSIAATAAARSVPKKRPDDHVAGKQIWERSCWQCHGEENDGQGPAAASLPGGVPDLRNTVTEESYGGLVDIILQGKGLMPAFGAEMDRPQARRTLIYMQKLDEKASAPPEPLDEEEEDEPALDDGPQEDLEAGPEAGPEAG